MALWNSAHHFRCYRCLRQREITLGLDAVMLNLLMVTSICSHQCFFFFNLFSWMKAPHLPQTSPTTRKSWAKHRRWNSVSPFLFIWSDITYTYTNRSIDKFQLYNKLTRRYRGVTTTISDTANPYRSRFPLNDRPKFENVRNFDEFAISFRFRAARKKGLVLTQTHLLVENNIIVISTCGESDANDIINAI